MSAYWGDFAPLVALLIALAFTQAAVVLTSAIRRRDYRLFEDLNQENFAERFPIPSVEWSRSEARWKRLSPLFLTFHEAANAAQTTYHNAVARSAACLVVAFIGLVFGSIPEQEWPSLGGLSANHYRIEQVLNWLDFVAILLVFILFLYARSAGRRWIAARVGTEFLRQYQILSLIFPDDSAASNTDTIKSQFDLEAEVIKARVQKGATKDIISRVELFWSKRRRSIESHKLLEGDVQADALLIYLQRRTRRQLSWFANSKARLEHIAKRRAIVLLILYSTNAILIVAKLVWFLRTGASPVYLLVLLLLVTGMSAAMTAYYFNQNARSLMHRYNTQQRRVSEWLQAFDRRWPFATLPSQKFDVSAKTEIRMRIIQFEDLMIEELVDWVHITSHDAIELAP